MDTMVGPKESWSVVPLYICHFQVITCEHMCGPMSEVWSVSTIVWAVNLFPYGNSVGTRPGSCTIEKGSIKL